MLVNIAQHFIEQGRTWLVGESVDVPTEVAQRWIADGKASADGDGRRDQSSVSGDGATSSASSVIVRMLSAVGWTAYDTSSFRQVFQVPVTGACLVRALYQTDAVGGDTVDNTAFAAGRAIADDNPIAADGTAAPWYVVTGTVLSASDAAQATNGLCGSGWTSWALLDVPAATDGGVGGYIYVGTKRNAGTGRCYVGTASRPATDWPATINALLPHCKYRALHRSGDYVTTAQGTMTGATSPSQYAPVVALEVIPVSGRVLSGVSVGDSTTAGMGTGTAAQPHCYNPASIAASRLCAEGTPTHIANWGFEGKTPAYYYARLEQLLADTAWKPSFVVIQPYSINDGTFVEANMRAALATAFAYCKTLRARGIIPILRTALPGSSVSAGNDLNRKKYNAALLASGYPVWDYSGAVGDGASPERLRAEYSLDGTHANQAGNEAGAVALIATLKSAGLA